MAPGSDLLQRSFFIIALVLIGLTHAGIRRASVATGDSPDVTRSLVGRFDVWALGWLAIVLGAAAAGILRRWDLLPPPFPVLAVTMSALGVAFARSAFGDRLARGLALGYLVLFQAFRLPLELLMHRAYTEGVMPVQMSYSGRNLDILTGASALVLGIALLIWNVPRLVVWIWNAMGLALLINIVTIAIASLPMFQRFGPDQLNTFVAYPPYVLLPAIMVLAAWAGHLVVFRALSTRS